MLINITDHVIYWSCSKTAVTPLPPDKIFESVGYGHSTYRGSVLISDNLYRLIKNHDVIIRLHNSKNLGYSDPLVIVNNTGHTLEPNARYGTVPKFSIEVPETNSKLMTLIKIIS